MRTITDAIQQCHFNTLTQATQSVNIIEQIISDEFKQLRKVMTYVRDKINEENRMHIFPLLEEIITYYGALKIVLGELVSKKGNDEVGESFEEKPSASTKLKRETTTHSIKGDHRPSHQDDCISVCSLKYSCSSSCSG